MNREAVYIDQILDCLIYLREKLLGVDVKSFEQFQVL